MEKYFDKFGLVNYNNNIAVNITERVIVRDFPLKNSYLYYPYDIDSYERPDQLADRVYNDQYMSWLIYLSNGIIDPYYDWLMSDDVFISYLMKKYGNVDKIQSKIAYYRNNWYNDSNVITTSQFDDLPDIIKTDVFGNTIVDTAKRYYEVVLTGRNITGYKRKKIDEIRSTNKIVEYVLASNSTFVNNEIVNISLGYSNTTSHVFVGTVTGNAQILYSNSQSNTIAIQHTSGYVDTVLTGYESNTTQSYIYGTESGANTAITSFQSLSNNILTTETVYWSPVTIFEDEVEKNLRNKTIRLIDPNQAQAIAERAAETLKSLL